MRPARRSPYDPTVDRELERWWWNGRWGRIARRDVKVYRDGDRYLVEAWQGGAEGQVRAWPMPDARIAGIMATGLMEDSDGWREMPTDGVWSSAKTDPPAR